MVVACTGHNIERLRGHEKEVKEWIREELSKEHFTEALSGMAMGVDQIFAEESNLLDIPLVCCYAYERSRFHPNEVEIISKSKEVKFINDKRDNKCFWIRDKYMVDNCDVLLAVWDGIEFGGTWDTIKYAKSIGKEIHYFPKGIFS